MMTMRYMMTSLLLLWSNSNSNNVLLLSHAFTAPVAVRSNSGTAARIMISNGSSRSKNSDIYQNNRNTDRVATKSLSYSKMTSSLNLSSSNEDNVSSDSSDTAKSSSSASSMSSSVFNLVKACIGAGVLAFPSGIAAFSDTSAALIPSAAILFVLGFVSAYSFYSIGRVCKETDSDSIGEAWNKIVSENSRWVVDASCFVTPLGAALSFSIILGHLCSSVVKTLLQFSTLSSAKVLASRQVCILLLTSLVLYPLCSLSSLAALAPVSIVGVVSSMLTCLFLAIRYLSGAYAIGGVTESALLQGLSESLRPSFGVKGMQLMSPSILILFAMAGTGYMCHFAAPEIQRSLKDNTKARFKQLTTIGFSITAILSVMFASFGFLTFGGASSGLILNNYATNDIGAVICRLFTAVSLIGSYPIVFAGARNAWFSLSQKGKEVTDDLKMKTTRIMLSLVTATALILEDSGFVVSLNGALAGSAIIYVFPAVMFLKSTSMQLAEGTLKMTRKLKVERIFNKAMAGLGVMLGLCGASVSVLSTFFPGVL